MSAQIYRIADVSWGDIPLVLRPGAAVVALAFWVAFNGAGALDRLNRRCSMR